jgi:hypothetical protein
VLTGGLEADHLIDMGAGPEDVGHPRVGENGDMGLGKIGADGPHRRGGHDRITDPVGGTDQNFLGFEG